MQELFKKFSVAYLAGALGGVAAGFLMWLFKHWKIFESPSLTVLTASLAAAPWAWFILKGSLWALILVPLAWILKVKNIFFGMILGLAPSVYSIWVVYPSQHHGLSAFSHEPKWFFMILVLNTLWGITASMLYLSHYKN
jgi:hypothetical protein